MKKMQKIKLCQNKNLTCIMSVPKCLKMKALEDCIKDLMQVFYVK